MAKRSAPSKSYVMAAFSEDGSEWSEYGYDEELHRDLSSLQEVLADDSRPG